ncbi:hypothetical protein HRbin05_00090 [archaeon HR05]|nr:hypothetical protein HRbin05_00090 [archaeon HR05]
MSRTTTLIQFNTSEPRFSATSVILININSTYIMREDGN